MKENSIDNYSSLNIYLDILIKQQDAFMKTGEMVFQGNLYTFDFFVIGVLNRGLDLIDGFIQMMNTKNINSSVPILRLQMDSLLRINFLAQNSNRDEYVKEVLGGKSFRDLKDINGKKLYDKVLIDFAKANYTWIENLYTKVCDYVHFSEIHIFNSFMSKDTNNSYTVGIGKGISKWTIDEISNIFKVMIHINDALIKIVYPWSISKNIEEELTRKSVEEKLFVMYNLTEEEIRIVEGVG